MNSTTDVEEETPEPGLSPSETTLLTLYCIVLVVGVLANAGLALTVCAQQGKRVVGRTGASGRVRSRSPLLLGLCVADLLVCCVSAPLTVCFALLAAKPWPFEVAWCKMLFFLQALPVAASTLSLMLLSVDRYITVKYTHPVMKLHQWSVSQCYTFATAGAWLLGFFATCPILAVRRIPARGGGRCVEIWSSAEWRGTYIVCRLVVIFIVPSVMVMACHLGVKKKLTALSLTARAAHGELPLPVPLLRRPAHVIIVAGLAKNSDGKVMTYEGGGEGSSAGDNMVDRVRSCNHSSSGNKRKATVGPPKSKRKRPEPYARRATRTDHEIRQENRRLRPHQNTPLPNAPRTSSTLRSRRRLANALVSAAGLFVGCWLPHVVCTVCAELCQLPNTTLAQYSLLLGHAHSAINPVVYWALNHQSLHSTCECFARLKFPQVYRNASSTNEAALGPFHPRYATARPANAANANVGRRQSSCYLY